MARPEKPEFEDEEDDDEEVPPGGPLLAYAQLLRLPNVFSAIADVTAGFLMVNADLDRWQAYVPLVATSICLYLAGMVLNDVFDAPIDAEERPERPIPSGRISIEAASRLGWGLWFAGVLFAAVAVGANWGETEAPWRAGAVGGVLAACVVLYDCWAKQTPLGPIVMGLCRMLNWLLGMSLAAKLPFGTDQLFLGYAADHFLVAGGMGLYIVGVTWLARDEADEPNVLHLLGATAVMFSGLAIAGMHVLWPSREIWMRTENGISMTVWAVAFTALAVPVARREGGAILAGTTDSVRLAVQQALMSVIIFDAAIAYAQSGPYWGIAVIALLAPAWVMARFVNTT